VDRQSNDHLGRSCFRPHLFEHRRQILRGCTESDTYAYSHTNINGNSDINTDTDSAAFIANTDGDCYADTDADSKA
jgi:hypothetical protein